jgi:Spy/CpxP family protein refolding chaperone
MSSIKIVLLIIVMSVAASFTNAQPKGHENNDKGKDGKGMQFHQMKLIAEKLHLTDQQKDKMKSLQGDQMKKMIDLKADLKKSMIDLKEIKDKANFTRADVLDQVGKLNKIKNDIALSKANHLMDLWEILTPEQQKIAKDNPEWFMSMGHKRMMHRGMIRKDMDHKGMPKGNNPKN